jgi:hypothetical protein
MNTTTVAKLFGCTEEQAQRQYEKNAKQLGEMAAKAERTGRKVNGYTAGDLRFMESKMLACAANR